MGRPKLLHNPVRVRIVFEDRGYARLSAAATRAGVPVSVYIRQSVAAQVRRDERRHREEAAA